MLRKATTATNSSAISSRHLSLKGLTTWLDTYHVSHHGPSLLSSPGNQRFASTRRVSQSGGESDVSTLPRFLRRQLLQESPSQTSSSKSVGKQRALETPAAKPSPAFRSRHYDATKETTPKSEIRLLEPHILSSRLKKLGDAGKLDDAIFMLKNAPLDAQNTQVWNTVMWEALKVQRYSLAYQLFVDMKRRGFSPSLRTFQTLFNGLARIENWATHTKQLSNARSLYENFQRHIVSVRKHDPNDPELSINPLAGYIRLLGNAGAYQSIFDAYYAMDQEGPLAPNQLIYTAMFQSIHTALGDTAEGSVKVAADARLLWNQMIKASKKNKDLIPDSHTVRSALVALSAGNQVDHELAFKIIDEFYGFNTDQTTSLPGKLILQPESFAAILRLCHQTKKYALCAQFYQQVRRRPEAIGGVSILDRGHMEEIIRADLALKEPGLGYHALQMLEWMLRQEITGTNGPKIRPSVSTYNLVMQACSQGADWNSATRAFDLMTGYHAHDFMDGSVTANPRLDKRGPGRSFSPNAEFMSFMLRTAIATRNKADARQILRIVDYLGYDNLVASRGEVKQETMKVVKRRGFFEAKFSAALAEAVELVLQDNGKYTRPDESAKFKLLFNRARGQDYTSARQGKPLQRPKITTPPES